MREMKERFGVDRWEHVLRGNQRADRDAERARATGPTVYIPVSINDPCWVVVIPSVADNKQKQVIADPRRVATRLLQKRELSRYYEQVEKRNRDKFPDRQADGRFWRELIATSPEWRKGWRDNTVDKKAQAMCLKRLLSYQHNVLLGFALRLQWNMMPAERAYAHRQLDTNKNQHNYEHYSWRFGEKYKMSPKCVYDDCDREESEQHVIFARNCKHKHPELDERLRDIRGLIRDALPNETKHLALDVPAFWCEQFGNMSHPPTSDRRLHELQQFNKEWGSCGIIPRALTSWLIEKKANKVNDLVANIQQVILRTAHSMWRERSYQFDKLYSAYRKERALEKKRKEKRDRKRRKREAKRQRQANAAAAAARAAARALPKPAAKPAATPRPPAVSDNRWRTVPAKTNVNGDKQRQQHKRTNEEDRKRAAKRTALTLNAFDSLPPVSDDTHIDSAPRTTSSSSSSSSSTQTRKPTRPKWGAESDSDDNDAPTARRATGPTTKNSARWTANTTPAAAATTHPRLGNEAVSTSTTTRTATALEEGATERRRQPTRASASASTARTKQQALEAQRHDSVDNESSYDERSGSDDDERNNRRRAKTTQNNGNNIGNTTTTERRPNNGEKIIFRNTSTPTPATPTTDGHAPGRNNQDISIRANNRNENEEETPLRRKNKPTPNNNDENTNPTQPTASKPLTPAPLNRKIALRALSNVHRKEPTTSNSQDDGLERDRKAMTLLPP